MTDSATTVSLTGLGNTPSTSMAPGSVASLEVMFDQDRLKETHIPGGWKPLGSHTHAIKGHEFGLHLDLAEREQLIAFLRTL